jgi:glycosyltransferase involved in cell wall biosynthesis
MEPYVTIAMCVKNAEAIVKEAVKSVLSQDYSHDKMEIIVVDGSSVDNTVSVIKSALTESSIGARFLSENKGLGFARQIAINAASGKYVIWVDGDLLLPSDFVSKQVDFMEKNPIVGIAGGIFGELPGGSLPAVLENLVYAVSSSARKADIASKFIGRSGEEHRFIGTEGSIYRVRAIQQVKGFDINIMGAAEDVDLAYRVKKAGWKLSRTEATFYEVCRGSWKELWKQYVWYGYGGWYLFHKDRTAIPLYEMLPLVGFVAGLLYSIEAYRLTRRKISFLLPLQYTFKRIAWCFGFVKGLIERYGSSQTHS